MKSMLLGAINEFAAQLSTQRPSRGAGADQDCAWLAEAVREFADKHGLGERCDHDWERHLTGEDEKVLNQALTRYGLDAQLRLLVEECGELIVEISHSQRGRPEQVSEEVADVQILINQLRQIQRFDLEVDHWIKTKMKRLKNRLGS